MIGIYILLGFVACRPWLVLPVTANRHEPFRSYLIINALNFVNPRFL